MKIQQPITHNIFMKVSWLTEQVGELKLHCPECQRIYLSPVATVCPTSKIIGNARIYYVHIDNLELCEHIKAKPFVAMYLEHLMYDN